MKDKYINHKYLITILFIACTILLTWLLQFMPLIIGMDVSDTSISSFDYASIFFTIGGVMPTLVGTIFVLVFYKRENIVDFLKRCFIPNVRSVIGIGTSLALVCIEVVVTQIISKSMGGTSLGFEGLKLIITKPWMLFYFLFWGLISGPLSEEIGWRGFLTDQLFINKKNWLFIYPIIIGLIWGIWHLPLYFYPAQIQNEWFNISPLLGIGFIICCITNALVYNAIYIFSKRKVFPIFFLHMFKNIILTGAMIYPFSEVYKIVVVPVEIVLDLLFYFIFINLPIYKKTIESI